MIHLSKCLNTKILTNIFRNCNSCTNDAHCGFCFSELSNNTYDGECLASASNEATSLYGACNSTKLSQDMGWAFNWCPSQFAWMTFAGLLLYLVFFSPGKGIVCLFFSTYYLEFAALHAKGRSI